MARLGRGSRSDSCSWGIAIDVEYLRLKRLEGQVDDTNGS